ncbi:MAG: WD40-like beta Propeller containing protein [Crocinitomicaceae bacterium]|nr:WD40-like beta Propeller containing protein [Crocinitomicaceae bacterium]
MRVLLLVIVSSCAFSAYSLGQKPETDSLCCNCLKYNYEELDKVLVFKDLIQTIAPNYIQHTRSLSENIDLIQYEKFTYLFKMDRYLKYEVNKKKYALESLEDPASQALKLELGRLNEVLKRKSELLHFRISECEKLDIVKRYNSKKNMINSVAADYYTNYINLINSTIDLNKLDYAKLVELERKLGGKLETKKQTLQTSPRITPEDSLSLILLEELLFESQERINRFELNQIHKKMTSDDYPAEGKIQASESYFLKEIIRNSDSLYFNQRKPNEKQIIVANNTMYIFRNDTLIETIKNEDNSQVASVFDNRKPISVDNYSALFYTIQIGTYSKEVTTKELKVKSNLFYKKLPNGTIRYSFGMFNDLQEVEKARLLLEKIGITDVLVIAYYHKEMISLKEARKLKPGQD